MSLCPCQARFLCRILAPTLAFFCGTLPFIVLSVQTRTEVFCALCSTPEAGSFAIVVDCIPIEKIGSVPIITHGIVR